MKAIVQKGRRLSYTENKKPPVITGNQVLVEVLAAGLCGSDVHRINLIEDGIIKKHPVLGHEIAGIIRKKGDKVKGFVAGDRVMVQPIIYCRRCPNCRAGRTQFCKVGKSLGKNIDGGFESLVVVNGKNIFKLKKSISAEVGSLADPLAVAIHARNLAGGFKGKRVVVVGDGPMGVLTAVLAKAEKAKSVTVIGGNNKLTLKFKKIVFINRHDDKKMEKLTGTFDLAIESVGGSSETSLNKAVEMTTVGGQILVYGVYPENFLLKLAARKLFYKEIKMQGVNSYGMFKNKSEFVEAVRIINSGKPDLVRVISHRLPLKDFEEGVRMVKNRGVSGACKVVFRPQE